MLTRCTLTILSLNLNVWNHPSWAKFCQVSLTYKVRLYRVKEDKSIPSTGWCLFSKQNILQCYFTLNPPFFPPYHTTSNLFVQVLDWDTLSSGRIDPNPKLQKMLIKFPLDSDWCKRGGWFRSTQQDTGEAYRTELPFPNTKPSQEKTLCLSPCFFLFWCSKNATALFEHEWNNQENYGDASSESIYTMNNIQKLPNPRLFKPKLKVKFVQTHCWWTQHPCTSLHLFFLIPIAQPSISCLLHGHG